MKRRVAIAAALSTFAFAASAEADLKSKFICTLDITPSVDMNHAYLVVGGTIFTQNAGFDQLLCEAQLAVYGASVKHLGNLEAGNTYTFTTQFTAYNGCPNADPNTPTSNIGQILTAMVIGDYGNAGSHGVVVGYDDVAGSNVISGAAHPWTGTSIPYYDPSPAPGSVRNFNEFVTESSLYDALQTSSTDYPTYAAWPLPPAVKGAALKLANMPFSGDGLTETDPSGDPLPGSEGYAIPTYKSRFAKSAFRENVPLEMRPIKLVKFSDAADGGTAHITVSGPQAVQAGDFDGDDLLNDVDIDLLLRATPGTVPVVNGLFNLNGDSQVIVTANTPASDTDVWVRTLKSSEYGDTDLDHDVDFDDLLTVAQHYEGANAATGWARGDFTGDSVVGFDDLLRLAQYYGFGGLVESPEVDGVGNAQFRSDWALARSVVPEPAVLGVMLFSCVAMPSRRRRAISFADEM